MSRKVIVILFILATCLYIPGIVMMIWGYATLFQQISTQAADGTTSTLATNAVGTFTALFLGGAVLVGLGGIVQLIVRIGALMEMAKAQSWTWFVLTIIFDWFVILAYLIAVRPKPANLAPLYPGYPPYPYAAPAQPWPAYPPQAASPMPQVPGAVPPTIQAWPAYPTPQTPGAVPPTVQAWSNTPMQTPGATQPAEQPLPYPIQTPQQKVSNKPQE
jgi:hypothetical protein